MANSSLPTNPSNILDAQTHGTTEIRQRKIANLIANGFSVRYVAEKLHMSESRIHHLLSDKKSLVNAELNRLLEQLFTGNDRHMVKLFNQTLEKLQTMLSSNNEEDQLRAMDRIIKIYMARSTKNGVTVKQYFGLEPPGQKEFGLEDYLKYIEKTNLFIKQRRMERGLPDDEDSSNSTPENSASPTPVSETTASKESSPPDLPAETRKFLDDMDKPPPSE